MCFSDMFVIGYCKTLFVSECIHFDDILNREIFGYMCDV